MSITNSSDLEAFMDAKYVHEESVHNLQAPKQIVPLLMKMFNPTSVIDVGCGLGTFLHEFHNNCVKTIHGIDGSWANKELLSKYISLENFEEVDLEKPYYGEQKYDLAICLEVAEHLKPESASTIVNTLTNLSDVIVFSAAVPFQGGMNHINEQWSSYWEELFEQHNYKMLDIIRPAVWDNPDIFWWYKQNMMVVAKDKLISTILSQTSLLELIKVKNLIHPELYDIKCKLADFYKNKADLAYEGRLPLKEYLKMLKKWIWTKKEK